MTDTKKLLLISLLLTGAWCQKKAVFVYSRLGADAVLPCSSLPSTSCSSISWTFYKGGRYTVDVSRGLVEPGSDRAGRLSVTSSCSLRLRGLVVEDAGSYVCLQDNKFVTDVYLSLLSISSPSTISDLQPGGNLVLNCVLFTFYDAGSCKSYSSLFSLRWMEEDGAALSDSSRYQLTHSRCNITLVTKLQAEDDNRKWRCQVNTTENSRAVFLDFTSSFLLQHTDTAQTLQPPVTVQCPPDQLPISRIVLCAALPLMVAAVGVFTWRLDRRRAKTSAASIELQQVH